MEPRYNVNKKVRFSEMSTLVVIRPKSAGELKRSWYSKNEIKQFEQNATRSAKILLESSAAVVEAYIKNTLVHSPKSQAFDGVEEHVRGIEHKLSAQISRALLTARNKTVIDVLQEQARQKLIGENDFDEIAAVSKRVSLFPVLWRRRIAAINSTD